MFPEYMPLHSNALQHNELEDALILLLRISYYHLSKEIKAIKDKPLKDGLMTLSPILEKADFLKMGSKLTFTNSTIIESPFKKSTFHC